ncbi:MAG: YdcH family protein [Rhodoferax sp.]|nr:YdcH family protein [Rhodoferax sp.]
MDSNLHSPERRLIELRIEHGDLDAMIDRANDQSPLDELLMRRLKKRRLGLRDEMTRIERILTPDQPA